tara:strand:+ start:3394 stop:3900 length:507 start_codon:yes stop_codon:yes gene_type:complete
MGKESKDTIYKYGGKRQYYQLRRDGIYNTEKILKALKKFLKDYKYKITDKDHSETMKSSGREVTTEWNCEREVNDYIKFFIEIIIIVRNQIDVLVDNKKLQKGDIEFRLKAYMKKNWKKTFKTKGVGEIERHVYEKFIAPLKLEDYEDKIKDEGTELINIAKEHLSLK